MPGPLVLASTASHRATLLARLEIPFVAAAHRVAERNEDHHFTPRAPEAFALRLALAKARSLAPEHPRSWILAADQLAIVGHGEEARQLHRPGSIERAIDQLVELSGTTHRLVNAVVLLDAATDRCLHAIDVQHITMRAYGRAEARAYVERWRPIECAGGYRIEDAGIKLVAAIAGEDDTGVIGLPLLVTCRLLREAGLLT